MIEVKHWNLVTLLHQLLELIIQLDAQKNGVDIDTTTSAGSCRCSGRGSLLHGLLETGLGCGRAIVLGKPFQVLVDRAGEDLIENRGDLHQLEIEEL